MGFHTYAVIAVGGIRWHPQAVDRGGHLNQHQRSHKALPIFLSSIFNLQHISNGITNDCAVEELRLLGCYAVWLL
jgi:hypothetical protein